MPQSPTRAARAATPDAKRADSKLVEALARMLFDREFRIASPDASAEAKRDAWKAGKAEHLKTGRYLAGRLEKAGFSIVAPEKD